LKTRKPKNQTIQNQDEFGSFGFLMRFQTRLSKKSIIFYPRPPFLWVNSSSFSFPFPQEKEGLRVNQPKAKERESRGKR
jgi:hypothetical protein